MSCAKRYIENKYFNVDVRLTPHIGSNRANEFFLFIFICTIYLYKTCVYIY